MSQNMLFYTAVTYFAGILSVLEAQHYTKDEVYAVFSQTADLSARVWTDEVAEKIMKHIEENLQYHDENRWTIDMRAAFQIFLTKLSLKSAMDSPRMKLYDKNDFTPINRKRMGQIIERAETLCWFFRNRLLARVPRVNNTRLVAAIFAFTPEQWYHFLPPMSAKDDVALMGHIVDVKFGRDDFPTPAPKAAFDQNIMLEDDSAKDSLYIARTCIAQLTRNQPVNESAPEECRFDRVTRAPCHQFVERGVYNKTSGYEVLFRIALLTAARVARNCFIFSESRDKLIRDYLCMMARLEADRLNPATFQPPPDYYAKDSLTRHDFATLCLLNGYNMFVDASLLPCGDDSVAWGGTEAGCYGKKGQEANLPEPLPLWTVLRPNVGENGFCYRRLTASCIAQSALIIRALVELGPIEVRRSTTHNPALTSTEDDYR